MHCIDDESIRIRLEMTWLIFFPLVMGYIRPTGIWFNRHQKKENPMAALKFLPLLLHPLPYGRAFLSWIERPGRVRFYDCATGEGSARRPCQDPGRDALRGERMPRRHRQMRRRLQSGTAFVMVLFQPLSLKQISCVQGNSRNYVFRSLDWTIRTKALGTKLRWINGISQTNHNKYPAPCSQLI